MHMNKILHHSYNNYWQIKARFDKQNNINKHLLVYNYVFS
jgi:hypothetical protein